MNCLALSHEGTAAGKVSTKAGMLGNTSLNTAERLWVRMKREANKADDVAGIYCKPPRQDDTTDELFYKEIKDKSTSTALVFMGDFNFPDINREYHTVESNRYRKFLKHTEGNFLVQVLREMNRKGALLGLWFVNREELVGKVVIGGCLQVTTK